MRLFADVIPVLIKVLKDSGYEAGVSTPEKYTETPFVQVGQVGGGPAWDEHGDFPIIDVTVHARGYTNTRKTALRIRQQINNLQATRIAGGFLFDRAHCVSGPIWVDNKNPDIAEFLLTFEIGSRTKSSESTHLGV